MSQDQVHGQNATLATWTSLQLGFECQSPEQGEVPSRSIQVKLQVSDFLLARGRWTFD